VSFGAAGALRGSHETATKGPVSLAFSPPAAGKRERWSPESGYKEGVRAACLKFHAADHLRPPLPIHELRATVLAPVEWVEESDHETP